MSASATLRRFGVFVLAAGLLAAACGDDGDDTTGGDGGTGGTSAAAASITTRTPVAGGTVTFAATRPLTTFDPAGGSSTFGCCGGTEMAALYDVLLRFDPDTQKYEGRTAQSFTSNADFTVWTLKIKPSIAFTDGTPYNADAVKVNLERHLAAASRSTLKPILAPFFGSMRVVDPLTLEITLTKGWAGMPTVFAREGGMIASPAAMQAAGANFGTAPGNAGAGPFMLSQFKPGEVLELKKNPNYWNGPVYLDMVRAVNIRSGDAPAMADALKTGTLDLALLRDPVTIAAQLAAKVPGVRAAYVPMLTGVIMNSGGTVTCNGGQPAAGCAGKTDGSKAPVVAATTDVNVRRAVAAAVDAKVVNERAYEGKATATAEVFPSPLRFAPGVAGVANDLAEAKRLVGVAKAAGWSGKIRVSATETAAALATQLVIKTALEAAGMEVTTETVPVAQITTKVIVNRDYDIATWALGFSDDPDNNYAQFVLSFTGEAPRYGYSSPEVDAGLSALRVANTDDARKAAMKTITTAFTRDAPFLSFAMGEEYLFHNAKLNGVQLDGQSRLNLDKAWLG